MNYGTVKYCDIANGTGVRTSLFVSGCTHRCKGCFNPETWSFDYGKPFDMKAENDIIEGSRPAYISGLSLLGGEPMEPANQKALLGFLRRFKKELPCKTVWCYSGCTFEQLAGFEESPYLCEETKELLSYIDVLVDGEFAEELKDITLRFRGSSNQRVLDLKKSLEEGRAVMWRDDPFYAGHKM